MPWHDRFTWPYVAVSNLQVDVAAIRHTVLGIPARLNRLENIVMATAAELITRLNTATDEVAADLADVRERLETALTDQGVAIEGAVAEALSGIEAPVARLEQLGADPADPIPPVA